MSNYDPDHRCTYQDLYTGAQRSLTDLAAKQAAALGKYGNLRINLVKTLKRYFPDFFAQVELAGNFRISDVADATLINLLEEFITNAQLAASDSAVLGDLKVALEEKGFNVSGCQNLDSIVATIKATPEAAPAIIEEFSVLSQSTEKQIEDLAQDIVEKEEDPAWIGLEDLFNDDVLQESEDTIRELDKDANVVIEEPVENTPPTEIPAIFSIEPSSSVSKEVAPELPVTPPEVKPSTQPALFIKPSVPKAKKKKGKKPIRVEASSDFSITDDILFNDDIRLSESELTDEIRNKLTSSVLIPRPVFVQDLIDIAGSRSLVEEWIDEISQKGKNSAFKFVGGKTRHRARGALVFPVGQTKELAEGFVGSWWDECLSNYRGSALYEIGVLMHRIGANVVTTTFNRTHAVIRVQQGSGLVGIVASIGKSWGEDGATRENVVSAVRDIIKERLDFVGVLTTSQDTLDAMLGTLSAVAEAEDWKPGMSVVGALSWKWAEDDKHSAHIIIG